jgi:hypothetical protein
MRALLRPMRASRALFVLGFVVAAGAAFLGATGAGAGTAVDTTAPFAAVEENTCTGEMVALTGGVHLVIGATTSGGGTEQSKLQANLQGVSGTALVTGVKYVAVDSSTQTFVFDSDLMPFHTQYEETAQLVRQGESPGLLNQDDFYLHVLAHATVNANGSVSVDDYTFDTYCR